MSIVWSDGELTEAVDLLSSERLADFIRIARTESEAVALHQLCLSVAAALTPVVGLLEITLRNAVCRELRAAFGVSDWLLNPPAPFSWKGDELAKLKQGLAQARRAAYSKLTQAERRALDSFVNLDERAVPLSHEVRSKGRQNFIEVSSGQLVAQLTLFFWKRLFSADYEDTLWKRRLRRLFPNKAVTRAMVASHLEVLYQARNRIAHHEPVLGSRLDAVLNAIDFIAHEFGVRGPDGLTVVGKMLTSYRSDLEDDVRRLSERLQKLRWPEAPHPSPTLASASD